jgi:hypothetical protein
VRDHRARFASQVIALLALIGSATTAAAQSLPVPKVVSSSQVDSGSTLQPFLTMTLPAGVEAGQLLLATLAIQGSNPLVNPWAVIALPADGWTEVTPNPRSCGNDLAMSIAYRVATTSDTAGTQFTWGFLSNGYLTPVLASGGIISIANLNTVNPIEQIGAVCSVQTTTVIGEPLNTLHNNDLSVLVYGITGDNDLSKPAGYSQIYQHLVSGHGPDIANDVKVIPVAGTNTGYQDSTAGDIGDSFGFQISLAPEN